MRAIVEATLHASLVVIPQVSSSPFAPHHSATKLKLVGQSSVNDGSSYMRGTADVSSRRTHDYPSATYPEPTYPASE